MKYFLCLICLLGPLVAAAQSRIITSVITDDMGEIAIGAIIMNKTTGQGTTTDMNGQFKITVKPGDILEIRYTGNETRQLIVTATGLVSADSTGTTTALPVRLPGISAAMPDSFAFDYRAFIHTDRRKSQPGVADFNIAARPLRLKKSQRADLTGLTQPQHIRMGKKQVKTILTSDYAKWPNTWHIDFSTAVDVLAANRLPVLQSQYAQGRPVNGAETWQQGDVFSWGPPIRSLENASPLVLAPLRFGSPAQPVSPLAIFRSGQRATHSIALGRAWRYWVFKTDFTHRYNTGILPGQEERQYVGKTHIHHTHTKFKALLLYNNTRQNLPQIGANWQTAIGNIYRTPPSFDNIAATNVAHSPQTDHPYAYLQGLPDRRTERNLSVGISQQEIALYKRNRHWHLNYALHGRWHAQNPSFGRQPTLAASPEGRYTVRDLREVRGGGHVILNYEKSRYKNRVSDFHHQFIYRYDHQQMRLHRTDGTGIIESAQPLSIGNSILQRQQTYRGGRNTHEITIDLKAIYKIQSDYVVINGGVGAYTSSTLPASGRVCFLPHVQVRFNADGLFNRRNQWPFMRNNNNLVLLANYGTSVQEAPLLYNQFHFNSLRTSVEQYQRYVEDTEMAWSAGLRPERNQKADVSALYQIYPYWSHRLFFYLGYFWHQKRDMLMPVPDNETFQWRNSLDLRNTGWEFRLEYRRNYSHPRKPVWQSILGFSRYRPVVTRLADNRTALPIAGYQDISAQAIVGQPFGVLVGSAYQRDAMGRMIIDPTGFPAIAAQPTIIGNPNPIFTTTWLNECRYRNLVIGITLDYQHGGQIWNGTQNTLDFLGRSQQSADQRTLTGVVFDGVDASGQPNRTAVDFAAPTNGLAGNRFARYGFAGVGEAAIQSATSLRISSATLSYDFTEAWKRLLPASELMVGLYADNLLLYSPYTGVDPGTTLLGYSLGRGLDLFNMPAVRTVGVKITARF